MGRTRRSRARAPTPLASPIPSLLVHGPEVGLVADAHIHAENDRQRLDRDVAAHAAPERHRTRPMGHAEHLHPVERIARHGPAPVTVELFLLQIPDHFTTAPPPAAVQPSARGSPSPPGADADQPGGIPPPAAGAWQWVSTKPSPLESIAARRTLGSSCTPTPRSPEA